MDGQLFDEVTRRLDETPNLDPKVRHLIDAALLDDLESPTETADRPPEGPVAAPRQRAYISSIAVEGFRGIGPESRLDLDPGPGLTLVVGRNGSGKSSFAEGLELLLTGDNMRWSKRKGKDWKNGFRNVHAEGTVKLDAEIVVEGSRPIRARRSWRADEDLDGGTLTLDVDGTTQRSVAALGWEAPLTAFRPFLSYNEIGSILDAGPTRLFDTLDPILGLDDLAAATDRLKTRRKALTDEEKNVKAWLQELLAELESLDDERARAASDALAGRRWKLDELYQIVTGDPLDDDGSVAARLASVAQLVTPSTTEVDAAASELIAALDAAAKSRGSDAERARLLVKLLEEALAFHQLEGMSQGELHALTLSLFLPRATLAESPFGFLFVDDPVQAMDLTRVDGLARVLEEVSASHQVVVFTHDDRLPAAVRGLGIKARILEVERGRESVVEVRTALDPVRRHLDDAFAMASTEGLPAEVAAQVVPGLCRHAVEAACIEVIRRRRLRAGEPHAVVEGLIENQRLYPLLALLLADDANRVQEAKEKLGKRIHPRAATVVDQLNRGSHQGHHGDLKDFVRDAEMVAQRIQGLG